jgi:hypothetical protein
MSKDNVLTLPVQESKYYFISFKTQSLTPNMIKV